MSFVTPYVPEITGAAAPTGRHANTKTPPASNDLSFTLHCISLASKLSPVINIHNRFSHHAKFSEKPQFVTTHSPSPRHVKRQALPPRTIHTNPHSTTTTTTASPPPPPRLLWILRMQTTRLRKEVQHIGQTNHATESPGDMLTRQRGSGDRGRGG